MWESWTYTDYLQDVEIVAKGYNKLGLQKLEGVGIMAPNCPEWYLACIGTMAAGGVGTGIYTSNSPEMVSRLCSHAPLNILVLENIQLYEKLLDGRRHEEAFPTVRNIILFEGETCGRNMVLSWKELMDLGQSQSDQVLRDIESKQGVNEAALLLYTSGTTGTPKGKILLCIS